MKYTLVREQGDQSGPKNLLFRDTKGEYHFLQLDGDRIIVTSVKKRDDVEEESEIWDPTTFGDPFRSVPVHKLSGQIQSAKTMRHCRESPDQYVPLVLSKALLSKVPVPSRKPRSS